MNPYIGTLLAAAGAGLAAGITVVMKDSVTDGWHAFRTWIARRFGNATPAAEPPQAQPEGAVATTDGRFKNTRLKKIGTVVMGDDNTVLADGKRASEPNQRQGKGPRAKKR